MTTAVDKLIEDAERFYSQLEVDKLRHAIEQSGISEDEFKALLIEMADEKAIAFFEDGSKFSS